MFDEMGAGIICNIKNNKIVTYLPFANFEFKNKWSDNIKLSDEYKSFEEYFADKNSRYPTRNIQTIFDKKYWFASDCLIHHSKGKRPYVNSQYWTHILHLIKTTLEKQKIHDCTFFINKKIQRFKF